MELVYAYDENNEFTGVTVDRWEALEKGYWKRGVSCWVVMVQEKVIT